MNTLMQHFWTAFTTLGLRITGEVTEQLVTCGVGGSTRGPAPVG